jgi:alkanesulfonate monooxygenase SsuD/methylene tetrahydromethanopterin reductase-like flavin-dependent oxidoreductase (luciferase family)
VQKPHPPVWVPVTGSKDSIEWAANNDVPITPGLSRLSGAEGWAAREDIIRHYALCLAKRGKRMTPAHLNFPVDCYVADSKTQALKEYGRYQLYFQNTLLSYDHVTQEQMDKRYYSPTALDYLRPDAKATVRSDALFSAGLTMEKLARQAEDYAWGTPDEVTERIIDEAEHAGAETVLLSCNRGAMPQEMFLNQIRRIGEEVLPRLHAHKITRVRLAEGMND